MLSNQVQHMDRFSRVGVIIDLSWTFRHRHGIFAGTQRYAEARGGWD